MSNARWLAAAVALAAGVLAPALPSDGAVAAPTLTLTPPGCTTAVAPGTSLAVSPSFTNVPGLPFDVVSTSDGRFTFVSSEGTSGSGGGEILVDAGDGRSGRQLATVSLGNLDPAGMALSDHGRLLLVAASADLVMIDVSKAEHGGGAAVIADVSGAGSGAIEVAPTPDGKAAFVSMEDTRQVDVFRLSGKHRPKYVGAVPVEALPVGIAFGSNGRTAYVTSEEARSGNPNSLGTLSVLNVPVAERNPTKSVEHTAVAGCAPVRVVVAPGGTVWVTARQSDAVLGFSASDLATGKPALLADVTVGEAPVGMALFDDGQRLLVADSNRFSDSRATSTLAVVDLTGTPGLVGYVPAGVFPRQMTLEPGGKEIDVTNYMSSELETVPLPPLVSATR